jgi:pSer/pThr/pTyr-binding forkhead associated (FHA) protein
MLNPQQALEIDGPASAANLAEPLATPQILVNPAYRRWQSLPIAAPSLQRYIQAIRVGQTAFLTTNLVDDDIRVTDIGLSWLVGRSLTAALNLPQRSISRFHAVIGYYPSRGFYVIDLRSRNGTSINQQSIPPLTKVFLQDGDVVKFCQVAFKFFISGWQAPISELAETQVLSAPADYVEV